MVNGQWYHFAMNLILQNFYTLLLISVIFNVTANILLKTVVTKTGGISADTTQLLSNLLKVAFNPYLIIGLTLYGFSFLIWLRVLTFNDLSRSYPIFATIVFLLTTFGSVIFLNENVTLLRVLGICIMLFGIFLVARY